MRDHDQSRSPRGLRPDLNLGRCLSLLLFAGPALLLGCSLLDWTTSASDSDSDTDSTGGTDATGGSGTTGVVDPALCGDPPAAPACAPTTGLAPLTTLCRARTNQTACLADSGGDSVNRCAWATIETYSASDLTCSLVSEHGECIGIQANASSCPSAACDGAVAATAFYRFNDQCQVETFTASLCGWQVLDWDECQWDGSSPDACSTPWPSAGPPSCRCHC